MLNRAWFHTKCLQTMQKSERGKQKERGKKVRRRLKIKMTRVN